MATSISLTPSLAVDEVPPGPGPLFAFFMQLEGTKSDLFVQGITEGAQELSARVVIHGSLTNASFSKWDQGFLARRLAFRPADFEGVGFSACGPDLQQFAVECHAAGQPTVLISRRKGEVPSVIGENRNSFRAAVRQLAGRGHRRIAYVSGPEGNYTAEERLTGYREGLAEAGLTFDPALVVLGDYSESVAQDAVRRLIEAGVAFTALIAANDVSALGAMSLLEAMGRRIPTDVEVIGFDNIPRSRGSTPPLSTFDLELFQQGYVSIGLVVRQARGVGLEQRHPVVPTAFLERGSTRSARRRSDAAVFTAEWPEERFRSAVHLKRLLRNPQAAAATARLRRPGCSAEDYFEALAELLARQTALRLNASCLYPLFHDIALAAARLEDERDRRGAQANLVQARVLLAEASFEEQRRRAETAILFASATAALHELLVEAADEVIVVDRLRKTLRNLEVRSAGLFLHPPVLSDDDRSVSGGQWWDLSKDALGAVESGPVALDSFSVKERMAAKAWTTLMVMPLAHGGEQFGLLILEAGSEFVVHYTDLVRDLATVLYGSRTHFALAAVNQELEVAAGDLAKSYEALRASEYFYHSLVESLPQLIVRKDAAGTYTYSNQGFSELLGRPIDQIVGRTDDDLFPTEAAARHRATDSQAMAARRPIEHEDVIEVEGGKKRYFHVKLIPLYSQDEECLGVQVIAWDMTVFRETEQLLRQTQRELIETSRLAGVAEVATSVLHNIGNAINSVNTAVSLAVERLHGSKASGVKRLAELISSNAERLPEFFAKDSRARQVPNYLQQLSDRLSEDHGALLQELKAIQSKVEEINDILAAQESLTGVEGINEVVAPTELIECALRSSEASLNRQIVTVVRQFVEVPRVSVQRHKVLQILVNLIRNAEEAMEEALTPSDRVLRLSLGMATNGNVQIGVTDSGVGIAKENLTRIFAFGFTTKRNGYGFALHTSALAAKEMGGTLRVSSPGTGKGATFVLELPPAAVVVSRPATRPPALGANLTSL